MTIPDLPRRLFSLDVLRGLTIAFMIMVNNNGGSEAWAPMHHAVWNGMTATDLVFPTFLFVVGVSIVFAYQARLARGEAPLKLARHTLQRAVLLSFFGILVNTFPSFEMDHLRFYGVLQRIALCYLLVSLFYLFDRRLWTKIIALAVSLLGYWALMTLVPVPGAGLPGRDVKLLDKDQNIVAWVDRQLMPGHLYESWNDHNTRDPEGLLSTLPALGTTLLGLLTALWLRSEREARRKALGLLAGSVACLALGYLWSLWFPLNKKLWTSSYVLVAAGYALGIFALIYWVLDVKLLCREGRARWLVWPWLVFGSNAIAAYLISELGMNILGETRWMDTPGHDINTYTWYNQHVTGWITNPGWHAFSFSFSTMLLCFLPVCWMYRKKIFWKI
ncbi:acyltransferase family protein [Telmatobacter bradus]|uniref:acyltransferase family protein n=1 Tax=Telmatobacter bradus TaxID=474953 RepID=UPI003B431E76